LVQPASLLVTALVMLWSVITVLRPTNAHCYPVLVSGSLVLAFIAVLLTQIILYVKCSPDGHYGAWLSILASQALNYAVAISVLGALFSHAQDFVVTPKMVDKPRAQSFPRDCMGELAIFTSLIGLSCLIFFSESRAPGYTLWALMLVVRGIPYGLAVVLSIFSKLQSLRPGSQPL
jgi:hypothetical protein